MIKFSNYSLCITLPKWVVRKLKWEKGEEVNLFVDEKKAEILISKGKKSLSSVVSTTKSKPAISNDNPTTRW